MKSQLTFTPEVLTCCTLDIHCDYYLTLLVIYEHLNILAMFCYNLCICGSHTDAWRCDSTLLVILSVIYFEFKAHLTSMATTAFRSDTPTHLVCA